jgi:glyoxylase I family protein
VDIGLVVNDIEKSIEFYRDLLGFKYIGVFLEMPDEMAKKGVIFSQGFKLHGFQAGTSMIKLVEAINPPSGEKGKLDTTTGIRYMTFFVDDVNAIYDELSAKGADFVGKPLTIPGRNVTIAMLRDPDGNHVELVSQG